MHTYVSTYMHNYKHKSIQYNLWDSYELGRLTIKYIAMWTLEVELTS